ncbi:MAG: hypothetical protein RBS96_08795 [Dehalococcoidales bacterium]|jgi:hypothetical protein|nr:hypothetical protein [Dehalococcoidales bacterium]
MALSVLALPAKEKSTYVVLCSFTDENGDPKVPDSMSYTLTDVEGNVINGKQNVAMTPLAEEMAIVLTGDDLAVFGAASVTRVVTVEGTYNSATYGNGLALRDSIKITVDNLPGAL